MPVMDGITATKTLRQRGFVKPVLALTANAMKGFEREIEAGGFTGHMTKPIDIDALLARMAQLLGGRKLEGAEAAAAAANAAAASQPAAFTPVQAALPPGAQGAQGAPLTSRLASHPRLAKVAARFCAELPGRLDEMQSELQAGAHGRLAALAHWLKGAGGSVGYDAFFEPARELEQAAKAGDSAACAACLEVMRALAARLVSPGGVDVLPASAAARQVDAVLERARTAAAAGSGQPAAASRVEPPAGAPLTSRLASHPKLARVVANFCAQFPGKLAEMEAALESGEYAALAALAHWLKGAGGSVGFDALFEPARELELAAKSGDAAQARASLAQLRALSTRLVAPEVAAAAAAAQAPA
jgi:HPt (histidine-containing phosphotransfer) domain-containing protein